MASYTAINGVPSSVNPWLLNDGLRRRWGFKGYVVSDCGAISHVEPRAEQKNAELSFHRSGHSLRED